MTEGIEAALSGLDQQLGEVEKLAAGALGRVKRLRRLAKMGDIGALSAQISPVAEAAERVTQAVQAAQAGFRYDAEARFADGSFLDELKQEAARQGVVLVDREGRLSAFPLLLKLDAKAQGVRVGRKLQRAIRPETLIRGLRAAQAANRFNARAFLEQVWRAYVLLAPQVQPGWTAKAGIDGPSVPLGRVHELLTLLPSAAAEYPAEAFACDLLRLNRAPDTTNAAGFGFDLPASTGSKGRERMTVYDEAGAEHVFVAVRFLAPRADAAA